MNGNTRQPKMFHILIAWELGGGLGHLTRIAAIAKALSANGYRVSLALRNLARIQDFAALPLPALFQAPLWQSPLCTEREPVCFSDILLHHGYGSVRGLSSMVAAWQSLLDTLQPDLLLADYAPTALLAAHGRSLPRVLLSSGFGELPPGQPDLCLRPWHPRGPELKAASEKQVVGVVNLVLKERGQDPIRLVSEIYQAERWYLFMVPEIDLWENRRGATYLPPPREPGIMQRAEWPEGKGPKIFAYLKRTSPQALPAIQSIARLPAVGVIICAGLSSKEREGLQRPGLQICPQPQDLTGIQESADVIICHGGRNTVTDALLAGKPLLVIPEQLEQLHNALMVSRHGAGLLIRRSDGPEQIRDALSRLISHPGFREASQAIAARNSDLARIDPVATVVACCERLLAGATFGAGLKGQNRSL